MARPFCDMAHYMYMYMYTCSQIYVYALRRAGQLCRPVGAGAAGNQISATVKLDYRVPNIFLAACDMCGVRRAQTKVDFAGWAGHPGGPAARGLLRRPARFGRTDTLTDCLLAGCLAAFLLCWPLCCLACSWLRLGRLLTGPAGRPPAAACLTAAAGGKSRSRARPEGPPRPGHSKSAPPAPAGAGPGLPAERPMTEARNTCSNILVTHIYVLGPKQHRSICFVCFCLIDLHLHCGLALALGVQQTPTGFVPDSKCSRRVCYSLWNVRCPLCGILFLKQSL